jgi:glycosyltransferase involved in cell wall biosynthesis
MPLSVLALHNYYQQPGGEDIELDAEVELLRLAGHRVHVEAVSNDRIVGPGAKIGAFFRAPYDHSRYGWVQNLIREHEPDIVHVHNFFPLLTPAIHHGARDAGVAVVQTIQNYRLFCANALLLRNGAVCEKCVGGSRYWGVIHRCYRGSAAGSFAVVRMQNRAFEHKTWDAVDRFIVLTEFARRTCERGGLPVHRISIKPNTLPPSWTAVRTPPTSRRGALFVGRLAPEKGVDLLLSAWANLPQIPLTIVGDGPEGVSLRERAPSNVTFTGALNREQVRDRMAAAQCLLMPSRWYEGLPLTAIEAFSLSLPIIAARIGSLSEIVEHGVDGWHVQPNDSVDLARQVAGVFADPGLLEAAGRRARATFEKTYDGKRNIEALVRIYAEAMESAKSRSTRGKAE